MFVLMLKKALPVSSNNGNKTTSSSHMPCAFPTRVLQLQGRKMDARQGERVFKILAIIMVCRI